MRKNDTMSVTVSMEPFLSNDLDVRISTNFTKKISDHSITEIRKHRYILCAYTVHGGKTLDYILSND